MMNAAVVVAFNWNRANRKEEDHNNNIDLFGKEQQCVASFATWVLGCAF
jgi:hypothetical protein